MRRFAVLAQALAVVAQNYTNVFPSSSSTGYLNWLWDRALSIDYQKTTNLQLGGRFTQTLSPSTYYEIKLNSLWTKLTEGSTPAPGSVPDSLIVNSQHSQVDWDKVIPQVITAPDGFSYLKGDDGFKDQLTRTISLDAALTSQVTKSHLLNGGAHANLYHIDVTNSLNTRRGAGGPTEFYKINPFEAALYAQDKMEFEGLIANVGLRWDLWSAGRSYYNNQFSPFLITDSAGNPINNPAQAPQTNAPIVARLQPRAGISFPVSLKTVFHLNYGSFMQRPSFQYVISQRVQQGLMTPIQLGNPRLTPETTNSYDVGVTQGLMEGFTLDVSGYYKDVKNLIDQATFTSVKTGATYTTWFNRDYADIRGFRVALTKRRGAFTGSINYQFGVATGKSATTSYAPVAFTQDTSGGISTSSTKVPVRDILLDFDRTHNLIINLAYETSPGWGPQLGGMYPFENFVLSSYSILRSGRPYTSPSNPTLINGSRSPGEYNTNIRLTRRIPNFFGTAATIYFEVFNLFDNKILNYDYVFATPTANTTSNITQRYEKYPIDDPKNGILYWPDTSPPLPWGVDQSFLIYSNSPRSFNLGMVIEL